MTNHEGGIDRRGFLRLAGLAGAGLFVANIPPFFEPNQARAAAVISSQTRAIDRVLSEIEASGIVLPSFLPLSEVQVPGWERVGPDPGKLNQDQWFPFAELNGQRVLHAPGGFLDKIGRIGNRHGLQLDPRGHEEQYAYNSLLLGGVGWRGHCHALSNMMAYQEPLIISAGDSFEYEGEIIDIDTIIEGYAAKHASDATVIFQNDQAGISNVLRAAIIKRWTPVASCPDPGRENEDWLYAIKEIRTDLRAVVGYNFGVRKIFPIEQIKFIYFPGYYDPNNPESVKSMDYVARRRTAGYINWQLDHNLLSHAVLNIPLDQPLPS